MGFFHEGERAVQTQAGVAAEARGLGRGISRTIPPGAGPFLEAQRIAVLAGVDDAGRVWASLVAGKPGFITAPDRGTLRLAARLPDADPLNEGLSGDRPLGVLVFDPERRRRLRINGRAIDARLGTIEIRTEEVFGNCPKYIQARAPEGEAAPDRTGVGGTGADASHRGGQPGFVRVESERRLRFPDYAGNNMFQTLGNIAMDPRVGLLFVEFDTGTTLQLTGRARILWARDGFADLAGGERAVEVDVDEVVEIRGQGPLGWRFLDYSPFNPR